MCENVVSCSWSHLLNICARGILALSTGKQKAGSVSVGGPLMTGPSSTGSSLVRPKYRALVMGWPSSPFAPDLWKVAKMIQNKSWPCHLWMIIRKAKVCSLGWFWWFLHILRTLQIWSETNEAVPNHHGASAGLCDRLDCCIVSSASDRAITLEGQGWTHTRPAHSAQRNGAFLWFVSKITQLSLKAAEFFGVGVLSSFWITHTETLLFSPAKAKRPELNYWGGLFHY